MVTAAVAQAGRALRYAASKVQADRGMVLAALAQDGEALQHASAELKVDKDMVRVGVLHRALDIRRPLQKYTISSIARWLLKREGSQADAWWQALRTEAATAREFGRIVAPLQRVAFVACFKRHLALRPVGVAAATSAHELFGDSLHLMPTQVLFDVDAIQHGKPVYETCARGPALVETPAMEVVVRAYTQGWQWRNAQEADAALSGAKADPEPQAECTLLHLDFWETIATQHAEVAAALQAAALHEAQLNAYDAELQKVQEAVKMEAATVPGA
eukprot:SAG31_NODE_2164_length_6283_cov_2.762451_7_plen_274_part_00